MLSIHKNRKAQSFVEYVMLVLVISAALIAMYSYMRRSINAKLKQVSVELDESKR